MGFVIECEAKITEYSAAVTWDFDDETLEFYGQPAFLQLTAQLPNGRRSSWTYTPDFSRITRSGFEFVECKTEKDLQGLVQKRPHAYSVDESGNWRYPPAEEHVTSEYGRKILRRCQETAHSAVLGQWLRVSTTKIW